MKREKRWHLRRALQSLLNRYRNLSMTKKISVAFLIVFVPMIVIVGTWFYNVLQYNEHYSRVIRNTSIVSELSLDFKKNYDYKIYLIVAGSKKYEQQNPIADIDMARRIISQAKNSTENEKSIQQIAVTERYFDSLEKYTTKIHQNIIKGGMYNQNREIWETGVQSVTANIQENILEILYYENRQGAQIYNDMQKTTTRMILVSVVVLVFLIGVTVLMITIIPRTITRPVHDLSRVTEQVAKGNLEARAHIEYGVELKVLGDSLNVMIENISTLIERVKEEQTNLREAELEILQMQINPHFLYNTLDTIVWLAETGEKAAVVNMVETLSEFFRSSLNSGKDIVSIAAETRHIASYLQIQQVRYQDILDYTIQIPEELDDCLIPKITLQPLVENALYHGIKYKRGRGNINVSGRLEEDKCVLVVEDNGIGMSPERLRQVQSGLMTKIEDGSDFYGLYNVNERIRLKFGNSYGLRIYSVYQEGTRVEIWLPQKKKQDKE